MPALDQSVSKVEIVEPAAGSKLVISADPALPAIIVRVRIPKINDTDQQKITFTYSAAISYDAKRCLNSPPRDMKWGTAGTADSTTFRIPITKFVGGKISLSISAQLESSTIMGSRDLDIVAMNPSRSTAKQASPNLVLAKIASHESSGMRQFDAPNGSIASCPLWSRDRLGGVGMFQITNPKPTDDEVWNWRENLKAGNRILNAKARAARKYANAVRTSDRFQELVDQYNDYRAASGLPRIAIELRDFDSGDFQDNSRELELDAIRGYNGWAGTDAFRLPLHEYRVKMDDTGVMAVVVRPDGRVGDAQWERVPISARPRKVGDPNYVAHVMEQKP
jgi:hypothetical protein